jgi:hypothetical protein
MDCAKDGFSATISTLTGMLGNNSTPLPVLNMNRQRQQLQLLLPPYRPRRPCTTGPHRRIVTTCCINDECGGWTYAECCQSSGIFWVRGKLGQHRQVQHSCHGDVVADCSSSQH